MARFHAARLRAARFQAVLGPCGVAASVIATIERRPKFGLGVAMTIAVGAPSARGALGRAFGRAFGKLGRWLKRARIGFRDHPPYARSISRCCRRRWPIRP